jgi:hypothetical protein
LDADGALDKSGKFGFFRPTIFPNDFWALREYAYPVNETIEYVAFLFLIIVVVALNMYAWN